MNILAQIQPLFRISLVSAREPFQRSTELVHHIAVQLIRDLLGLLELIPFLPHLR